MQKRKVFLIGFMAGYLGFNVAPLYTTNMGYLGQGDYGILLLILIAVILYLDRGEEKRKVTWLRISQWATFLILVAVIVTVFFATIGWLHPKGSYIL